MQDQTICSFPPVVDNDSRVLVLGTMPGAESLRQQRYYAYEQNHFWRIIFALYGLEKPDGYDDRIRFLHEKRIALWDVLESCVRPGSADADIRRAVPNLIPELLESHPRIETVLLNGNGATKLFKKLVQPHLRRSVHVETLPSTSPAYAIAFERKKKGWEKLKEFL
jgi:hypoxanthine-DNA glycosylase